MADDDMITITLPDGKEKEFKIVFTFDHNEKDYVVFQSIGDDEPEFFVAKVNPQTDGSGTLDEVDDVEVYDKAQELLDEFFKEIIDSVPADELAGYDCHCEHCDGECGCDEECDCEHEHGDDCTCGHCKK